MDVPLFSSGDIAEVSGVRLLVEIVGGRVKLTGQAPQVLKLLPNDRSSRRGLNRRERIGLQSEGDIA